MRTRTLPNGTVIPVCFKTGVPGHDAVSVCQCATCVAERAPAEPEQCELALERVA